MTEIGVLNTGEHQKYSELKMTMFKSSINMVRKIVLKIDNMYLLRTFYVYNLDLKARVFKSTVLGQFQVWLIAVKFENMLKAPK